MAVEQRMSGSYAVRKANADRVFAVSVIASLALNGLLLICVPRLDLFGAARSLEETRHIRIFIYRPPVPVRARPNKVVAALVRPHPPFVEKDIKRSVAVRGNPPVAPTLPYQAARTQPAVAPAAYVPPRQARIPAHVAAALPPRQSQVIDAPPPSQPARAPESSSTPGPSLPAAPPALAAPAASPPAAVKPASDSPKPALPAVQPARPADSPPPTVKARPAESDRETPEIIGSFDDITLPGFDPTTVNTSSVDVRWQVDAHGRVSSVTFKSTGNADVDAAIKNAVQNFRFKPRVVDGQPQPAVLTHTFDLGG
jgi:TonB family protein